MRTRFTYALLAALSLPLATDHAAAGEADVLAVKVERQSASTYRFSVTVRHADTGWDHYADAWDVVGPNGVVLGTRTLLHPHTTEQPFTRSLSGVRIPDGVTSVIVRARDSKHGYGGKVQKVAVPR